MTLSKYVEQMIRSWPTLYGCRYDVLFHLFCVDNKLQWVDGMITDPMDDPTSDETECMTQSEDDLVSSATVSDERMLADIWYRNMIVQFRRDNAELLAKLPWDSTPYGPLMLQPLVPNFYEFISPKGLMNHIPENILPDWQAGITEITDWLATRYVFCKGENSVTRI